MKTTQVDLLNIALMLVALATAFLLPFKAFLLAYAILGPLHYLTEISWLHQRDYFLPRRRQAVWLVVLLLPLLVITHGRIGDLAPTLSPMFNAGALGAALAFVFLRERRIQLGVIGASLLAGYLVADTRGGHDWLRLFLPTLVHVWLFTGAFVLVGALRNRSATGFGSLAVFLGCTAACFFAPVNEPVIALTDTTVKAYLVTREVNVSLAHWLGLGVIADGPTLFQSALGLSVARFIAFAYIYHYLNWFSKTSVIQWHRMSRGWALSVVGIWVASVTLYSIDYQLGLEALFTLSYLHVFLEFPLNGRSFAEIGRRLTGRVAA